MKLFGYNDFINQNLVNENLDQAKKLLRDTYKVNKAVKEVTKEYETDPSGLFLFDKDGENINSKNLPDDIKTQVSSKLREIKIDPEETRKVERSQILQKIRELLGDKLGYAYLFTYLLLIEKVDFNELKNILAKLIEYRDLLGAKNPVDNKPLLRRPIANYIDINVPNNAENLIDDLENINLYKATKRIIAELTPVLKKDYEEQPPVVKKQIEDLSLAFSKLGLKDGSIDKETQERLWKLFFGEMKVLPEDTEIRGKKYKAGDKVYSGQMVRFKNIRDFVKSAQNYIKNIDNTETVKFYESIEACNDMYGAYGAQVCFDENNILILEIKSFQANVKLNSHTRHCIKDSEGQWNSYIGAETLYNKQYYIYNFNLASYDTKSVIGITIEPKQKIRACHLKDDASFASHFKTLLNEWERTYGVEDLWSHFKPMSPEEIEEKKRRVLANRELVKKGLTLEQIKKLLVEDGADVNIKDGLCLDNAVVEGDVEKVKYLLDFGASPNLRSKQESTINKIADLSVDADPEASKRAFEILKYLLRAGAQLTGTVFKGLIGDADAVKFCLDNGLDPNFEKGIALRLAIKRGLFDVMKLLIERGADVGDRGINLLWAYESKSKEIVEYLINRGEFGRFEKSMQLLAHSPRLSGTERVIALKEMQKIIDSGKVEPTPDGYRVIDEKSGSSVLNYKEVVKKFGNLYYYIISNNKKEIVGKLKDADMSAKEIEEFLAY